MPGLPLRSSCLPGKHFTHRALSQHLTPLFLFICHSCALVFLYMWLQTGLGVGWEEMIHFSHCPLSLGPDSWGFPLLRQSHPFPGGGRLCMSVTPGRTIGAYKCSSPRHPYRSISAPPLHLTNSPPGMVPVSNPPNLHSVCHTDTPSARDPRTSRTLPILYPHIKAVLDRL